VNREELRARIVHAIRDYAQRRKEDLDPILDLCARCGEPIDELLGYTGRDYYCSRCTIILDLARSNPDRRR